MATNIWWLCPYRLYKSKIVSKSLEPHNFVLFGGGFPLMAATSKLWFVETISWDIPNWFVQLCKTSQADYDAFWDTVMPTRRGRHFGWIFGRAWTLIIRIANTSAIEMAVDQTADREPMTLRDRLWRSLWCSDNSTGLQVSRINSVYLTHHFFLSYYVGLSSCVGRESRNNVQHRGNKSI